MLIDIYNNLIIYKKHNNYKATTHHTTCMKRATPSHLQSRGKSQRQPGHDKTTRTTYNRDERDV